MPPRGLSRAGRPQKVTKTHMTVMKELQAFTAEMRETIYTTAVAQVLHQSKLYGGKEKKLIKSSIRVCQKA